ncbi:pyridoxamine 5'-phosphate oxidase family protein [Klenkia sp. LSe6-5]|uniref:Pyridoxamine 5'-phosphate oxidase family protein n=1 Tax=Klenkia sesuvii TaxID=3103137 RepID=A0ABU8DTI3_9ACTN
MSVRTGDREMEDLVRATCLDLLRTGQLGRLAFTQGALPAVHPVAYAVVGDEVVIPTRRGGKVAAANRHAVVAFEVDEIDVVARTGWNVTVVGPSRVVEDPREVEILDRTGIAPWVPDRDAHCYVAIQAVLVQGRRLLRPPGADG